MVNWKLDSLICRCCVANLLTFSGVKQFLKCHLSSMRRLFVVNLKESSLGVVDRRNRAYPIIGFASNFKRWHIGIFMNGFVTETCLWKADISAKLLYKMCCESGC